MLTSYYSKGALVQVWHYLNWASHLPIEGVKCCMPTASVTSLQNLFLVFQLALPPQSTNTGSCSVMACSSPVIVVFLLLVASSLALAADQSPIQDFCVADSSNTQVLVNGLACKDSKTVNASDFFFSGLHIAGNTTNAVGSKVTPVFATQLAGLNTLGISVVRIDYAPRGINPPHTHPRASEIITVLEGSLEVGFVTSNPQNTYITTVLNKGDVFVFPVGLVHYQRNVGSGYAVAIAALSSQNPGAITIANSVFGAKPEIPSDVLMKAFQLEKNVVQHLQATF